MKISRSTLRRIGISLGLVVIINLFVLGALLKGGLILAPLQTFSDETLMRASADSQPRGTIVIAAIDENAAAAYGRPDGWDRAVYANLILRLKDYGANVVAFNVSFNDAARNDNAIAAAVDAAERPKDGSRPMLVIMPVNGTDAGKAVDNKGLQFADFDGPDPVILQAQPVLASSSVVPDPGTSQVRSLPLLQYAQGNQQFLPLPLVTALAFGRNIPGFGDKLEFEDNPYVLHFGPYNIPIDNFFRMPIFFFSTPAKYPGISLNLIAEGKLTDGQQLLIKNHVVLVGPYGAAGLADDYPVPTAVNSKMDGVEIWANATQSLIEGKFITPQPWGSTFAFMIGLSLVAALAFVRGGALGWAVTIAIAVGYAVARYFLARAGLLAPTTLGTQQVIEMPSFAYVDVTLILSSSALFVYLFIDEARRRSMVFSTFGRYVTPAVAQELASRQASGTLNMGGSRRKATIMFGNLYLENEGRATETLELLNIYFDGIVKLVNKHGGTVNKYIGDHIMVLFNAPLDLPNHAEAACRAAFEGVAWVEQYCAQHPEQAAAFGVGLNTGPLVAGNMGSKNRMEYTVIGDTVNGSSRLSGVAKHNEVIISQAVLDELDGTGIKVEDRGEVRVKGRVEPFRIYSIMGFGDAGPIQVLQPEASVTA